MTIPPVVVLLFSYITGILSIVRFYWGGAACSFSGVGRCCGGTAALSKNFWGAAGPGANAGAVPLLEYREPKKQLSKALYVVVDDTVFVEYIIDGRQDYSCLLS
jgi:hypothetical protein